MNLTDAETLINEAWEIRDTLNANSADPDSDRDASHDTDHDADHAIRAAVTMALSALDAGRVRIASPAEGGPDHLRRWTVHQWLKKAVLLSFRLNANSLVAQAPGNDSHWWDKVPMKFDGWHASDFKKAGFRAVPPAAVRHGAFIAPGAVLMPSYVNIGAHIGEGTMIDSWATVGSCAQIGAKCHISGGVGIGGVLEPLQAEPVIIEDHCFIGARSEVAEGVIIREGAVLSMGVYLGASTKIVDRASGKILYGEVPPFAVVVPGSLPSEKGGPALYCAVIVKQVDARTRAKTSINELLRG